MGFVSRFARFFLIALFLVGGCSGQQSSNASSAAKRKIVIWHWMNDRKSAFDALARQYTNETGITVEFKLFSPPDIYAQKVIAAARAGNLPDVFGILGEKKTIASFIKAGHILDLSPFMTADNRAWQNSFYPQALDVTVFSEANAYGIGPGAYGVPIDTTIIQFIYNKEIFRQAGLDPARPPVTLDEFISYAKTIKAKTGKNGFICGWGEGWLLNCLATEWAFNVMGQDKFIKTLKGEVPYTDSDWITVFSLFAQLRQAGILAPNITTMINKESEDAFSKGKSGFSFNGSWAVNVYKQLGPELDYDFFILPRASSKFPVKVWGGAGSSFMVNAKSANAPEAVKFLRWLTAREQQVFLIKETNNLPSIKGCEKELTGVLKTLAVSLTQLTHPNLWPYNEDSLVLEVMNTGLQQIVMGVKTPEEVVRDMQETKQRVMRR
ncbi:MAG: extracellular solute-binding protein [Candidatus Omnitrophota bacterium]|nr:extracellular solute-binding protein [Candidatus Omnitrophota bacterium]